MPTLIDGLTVTRYERIEPHIVKLTLDRPHRMNAYTPELCREVLACVSHFRGDDEARVLLLTGSGRAFCAGGDVREDAENGFLAYRGKQFGSAQALTDSIHAVARELTRIDKPVIAAINGAAISGGLALAALCDYRIAAESARLGDASGRVGLLVDEGGAWLFPRLMGLDRALRMAWRSEIYDAATARELGLVSEVVADAELEERALAFARDVASAAPLAVRATKALMRRASEQSFELSLGDAGMLTGVVNRSEDAREGMRAFGEKREPVFRGR